MSVSQLLVAVNKLDAAEPPWDQVRFNAIKDQLQPFLELAGFKADKVRFVRGPSSCSPSVPRDFL